jgi:membrane protease YdiL (CAAX protease family)
MINSRPAYPDIKQSIALFMGQILLFFVAAMFLAGLKKVNLHFYAQHKYLLELISRVVTSSVIIWIALRQLQALQLPLPVINFKTAKADVIFTGTVAFFGIGSLLAILRVLLPLPGGQAKFPGYNLFSFLDVAAAAPVLEELFFRGIILSGLIKQYKPIHAIAFSSLLFGLAHLYPWTIIITFTGGCILGWIFYKTGSLATCIVIHSLNNIFSFLYKYRDDAVVFSFDQAGLAQIIILVAVATLSLIYLLRLFRRMDIQR